jgi:hypothetical protein
MNNKRMTESEVPTIELTDEERRFMVLALNEYGGSAKHAYMLLGPVFGQSSKDEWVRLVNRLLKALENSERLSDLDWARALFLTEISFGSDLVGCGLDFERGADERRLRLLRSLQYKVSSRDRFLLLLQNAAYPAVE